MIKSFSLYDNEFGLNYRGEESFKTIHGACFTIFIVFFILNVALISGNKLVNRVEPESLINHIQMTEEDYEEFGHMELTQNRMNVAFEFRRNGKPIILKPEYGTISFL